MTAEQKKELVKQAIDNDIFNIDVDFSDLVMKVSMSIDLNKDGQPSVTNVLCVFLGEGLQEAKDKFFKKN